MTIPDPNQIAKILNTKVIEKAYDDSLAKPLKETSKIVTNLIKTAHYILSPIQYLAARQDRLEKRLKASVEQVLEENRIEPSASLLIPVVNHLNYLDDENILVKLYQNLLARAMDKTRISEAHPAFIVTISQLSPDEALLLFELKFKDIIMYKLNKPRDQKDPARMQVTEFETTDFAVEKLLFPENFNMYISHLQFLNLISMSTLKSEKAYDKNNPSIVIGNRNSHVIFPTEFGTLFLKACL